MISKSADHWFRWSLVSLLIVALYGLVMRYKIAFDFPHLDQKNLLHAHSHFAFSGWISHVLYTGLTLIITRSLSECQKRRYNLIIALNLASAFGMLITFTMYGYHAISIFFSTASIIIAVAYAYFFIKDTWHSDLSCRYRPWAVTGLLLNVISALGPLTLGYMMASKSISQDLYLGSVYYYLHFQYNGWFFFGSMALAISLLPADFLALNKYFRIFCFTAVPTFFLSILWIRLPAWLYTITVIAAALQLLTWLLLLTKSIQFRTQQKLLIYPAWVRIFFYVAALALTIKFILQLISVFPALSQLVFGIRPIIIAYLHLVLLGIYSLFSIGYVFSTGLLSFNKLAKAGAPVFLGGVVLNELLLGLQGFAAFAYIPIPYINNMLFAVAVVLCSGAFLLLLSQLSESSKQNVKG